jgi:hypothetical protein
MQPTPRPPEKAEGLAVTIDRLHEKDRDALFRDVSSGRRMMECAGFGNGFFKGL